MGGWRTGWRIFPLVTESLTADLVVSLDHSDWGKLFSMLPPELGLEQQSSFEMVTSTRKELIKLKDSPFGIELFHLSDDIKGPGPLRPVHAIRP